MQERQRRIVDTLQTITISTYRHIFFSKRQSAETQGNSPT